MHVSPLCLGAMSIGDKWEKMGFGAMDKASSFTLLDAFYEAGGNFIDTANGYQDESSEEFLGEWMEARGLRDQMVIATKVRVVPRCGEREGDADPGLVVYYQLQTAYRHPSTDELRWEQLEVPAFVPRGLSQETPYGLRGHPLRPLGKHAIFA